MALPVLPLLWRKVLQFYQKIAFLIIVIQACVAYAAPTYTIIKDNADAAQTTISTSTESMATPTMLFNNFSNTPTLESQMQDNEHLIDIKQNSSNIVEVISTKRNEGSYSSSYEVTQTSPSGTLKQSLPIQKLPQDYIDLINVRRIGYGDDDDTLRKNKRRNISSESPGTASVETVSNHFSLIQEQLTKEFHNESSDMLKLIDLEKHDINSGNVKNIEKISSDNDGHDGVKVTKKKQLVDKHYISTTDLIGTAHSEDLVLSRNKNKTSVPNPTFKPVQNGFLGPIIMEEKTFSIVHWSKFPPKHKSSIESQLKDGKIVEIIAPMASLQEQTAVPYTDIDSTTMVAPKIKKNDKLNIDSVLSTTVFQVPDTQTSTTRLPSSTIFQTAFIKRINNQTTPYSEPQQTIDHNQQIESKIADIQIEVYESTMEPFVSSTNKGNEGYFSSPLDLAVLATRPPTLLPNQERFTQYVIDHIDLSTPESSIAPIPLASGKPEPAAIEIHINVSESMGNESEDLEFSYRQSEFFPISVPIQKGNAPINLIKAVNPQPKTNFTDSDELLVVEIIDTGDNNTENSASFENFNVNPIFTFSSDTLNDVPLKNIKLTAEISHLRQHVSDDLFMPDVRKKETTSPTPSPAVAAKSLFPDRDSDTIFYISNTEVKVGESLPTTNTNSEQQLRKSQLESQFFPVNYLTSTHPNVVKLEERQRFEEEIILSPIRNTANSMKIVRSQSENSPPLDVTYVGESVIEVEQLSGGSIVTATSASGTSQDSDVIIQPALLPEISIGVPIIGELPPQIELKEIEYLPSETNDQRLTIYENSETESLGNEVDKIMESSIQYGGDLIDEGGVIEGGGFDGVETSYPFGNLASVNVKVKSDADFSHITINHGANNLNRNELIADVVSLTDLSIENVTLKEIFLKNETDLVGNGTAVIAERSSNATAFSVMEDPSPITDANINISDVQTLIFACLATLLPLVVAVFLVFGLRYFYQKYQANPGDDSTNQLANGKSGEGDDGNEDISRDARVTKMHYNSADKDGVFVVEVSRGVNSKTIPNNIPDSIPSQRLLSIEQSSIFSAVLEVKENHEEVQIHQPPQERNNSKGTEDLKTGILQQIIEVDEPVLMPNATMEHVDRINANTGLSQSDLSSTSSADSNKQYSYGNQELYTTEHTSYSYPLAKAKSTLQAPAEEAQDDDHKSENGHKMEHPATQFQSAEKETSNENDMGSQLKTFNSSKDQEAIKNLGNEKKLIIEERHEKNETKVLETPTHIIKSGNIENRKFAHYDFNDHDENVEIEENGYDSIMSLPEPPSSEEIKQLNDFSIIEAHQLDSLPPPSPPPPLLMNGIDENDLQEVTKLNGDLYHGECTTPYKKPPDLAEVTEVKINLPVPLTPPTSPEHCNDGTKKIQLSSSVAVAIDVNGS